MRRVFLIGLLPAILILPLNLFAKCPITAGGKLELRAPAGNLIVDTTGTDTVEVEISNRQITLVEECKGDVVIVSANMSSATGLPDWKIRVPKNAVLDLATQAGNIQVGDTDGRETQLRTNGGKVTAGRIGGNALIVATEVLTRDIGGALEVRGRGGRLQVGNVGGDAQFFSTGGDITTGSVKGGVKADNGSGSISIRESNGNVVVSTKAGDITSSYVRGSFDGTTESGSIKLEKVGSWVHAKTGVGDIEFHLVPTNLAGDLHVDARSAFGNITMFLPEKISATIEAIVDKPALNAKRVFSEFLPKGPAAAVNGLRGLIPNSREPRALFPGGPEIERTVINDGKNLIKAQTSAGTITINKGN